MEALQTTSIPDNEIKFEAFCAALLRGVRIVEFL